MLCAMRKRKKPEWENHSKGQSWFCVIKLWQTNYEEHNEEERERQHIDTIETITQERRRRRWRKPPRTIQCVRITFIQHISSLTFSPPPTSILSVLTFVRRRTAIFCRERDGAVATRNPKQQDGKVGSLRIRSFNIWRFFINSSAICYSILIPFGSVESWNVASFGFQLLQLVTVVKSEEISNFTRHKNRLVASLTSAVCVESEKIHNTKWKIFFSA